MLSGSPHDGSGREQPESATKLAAERRRLVDVATAAGKKELQALVEEMAAELERVKAENKRLERLILGEAARLADVTANLRQLALGGSRGMMMMMTLLCNYADIYVYRCTANGRTGPPCAAARPGSINVKPTRAADGGARPAYARSIDTNVRPEYVTLFTGLLDAKLAYVCSSIGDCFTH
jgi:hypothetical protein